MDEETSKMNERGREKVRESKERGERAYMWYINVAIIRSALKTKYYTVEGSYLLVLLPITSQ